MDVDLPAFVATDKQAAFVEAVMSDRYRYLGYGGAIRGGKTVAGMAALFVLCKVFPGSRWAIVRKDLPTLRRNTLPSFNKLRPRPFVGDVNRSDWIARCENGSEIVFFTESIEEDPDLDRWKGLEVNGFLFEEANECKEKSWEKGKERAGAWIIPDAAYQPPPLLMATFNPTFEWPRRVFFEPWSAGNLKEPYFYCPATAEDNPHLPDAYVESLKNLPEHEYKRFVLGDWGAIEGQAFPEWRTELHVQAHPDLSVVRDWRWYGGLDWGYRSPGCLSVFAIGPDQDVRVMWDWYFREMSARDAGRKAAEHLRRFPEIGLIGADSAMWQVTGGGPTVGEEFQSGLTEAWGRGTDPPAIAPAPKGQGSRIARAQLTHELLRWSGDPKMPQPWNRPRMTFHPDAKNLIRTIPALMVDDRDTEDVDTTGDDHGWDSLTYGLMMRPAAAAKSERATPQHQHPGIERLLERAGKGEPKARPRFRTVWAGRE